MAVPHSPDGSTSPLTAKSNSLTDRRNFVPRPELCRKNRKGRVIGYGHVPGWELTLREIEDFLSLPHD
jgi:hypothetical protein